MVVVGMVLPAAGEATRMRAAGTAEDAPGTGPTRAGRAVGRRWTATPGTPGRPGTRGRFTPATPGSTAPGTPGTPGPTAPATTTVNPPAATTRSTTATAEEPLLPVKVLEGAVPEVEVRQAGEFQREEDLDGEVPRDGEEVLGEGTHRCRRVRPGWWRGGAVLQDQVLRRVLRAALRVLVLPRGSPSSPSPTARRPTSRRGRRTQARVLAAPTKALIVVLRASLRPQAALVLLSGPPGRRATAMTQT